MDAEFVADPDTAAREEVDAWARQGPQRVGDVIGSKVRSETADGEILDDLASHSSRPLDV
jgi:hypothetical protein